MIGVYVLESQKDHSYYVGSTNNLERRMREHNGGLVFSTKGLLPLELRLFHKCETLKEARKIEHKIKRQKRRDFIEKMVKNQRISFLGP